jgi:2'-5' RNA ligase
VLPPAFTEARVVRASAVILPLPGAEQSIGDIRRRHTPGGARGLISHVTLLSPFVDPEELDDDAKSKLADAARRFPSFDLTLTDVARFESGVLYLNVSPLDVVRELIARICAAFPKYIPYGRFTPDEVIPHCTLVTGSGFPNGATAEDLSVFDEVDAAIANLLPITCRAQRVTVMTDAPTGWITVGEFGLADGHV